MESRLSYTLSHSGQMQLTKTIYCKLLQSVTTLPVAKTSLTVLGGCGAGKGKGVGWGGGTMGPLLIGNTINWQQLSPSQRYSALCSYEHQTVQKALNSMRKEFSFESRIGVASGESSSSQTPKIPN